MKTKSLQNSPYWSVQVIVCLAFLLGFAITEIQAQQAASYTYATLTGQSLDNMSGDTQIMGNQQDNTVSSNQSIGFNFTFESTVYTNFSLTPDGFVKLGAVTTSQPTNQMTSTSNIPKLCPWWDDLATGGILSGGEVTTVLRGSAPNRIRVIHFFVTIPKGTGFLSFANATFQVWLYETTNVIEFRYGSANNSGSATVGIRGAVASPASYISITSSSHASSTSTANDNNSTWPGNGRMYRFTPAPVACSGTPNPGATISSFLSGCPGQTFTLSLQNVIPGAGVSYAWQSAPSSSGPWNSFGAANAAVVTTSLTNTTWYRCVVTCSANPPGTSTPVQVIAGTCCDYRFRLRSDDGAGWDGAIMEVRIGTTVIATLGSTFTSGSNQDIIVPLMDGTTYNLFYLNDGTDPNEVGIRIFDNSNVQIYNLGFGNGNQGSILHTWAADCPIPCSGPPVPGNALASQNPVCSTDLFSLSLQNIFTVGGITYQWQTSPNNSTWTNIASATNATLNNNSQSTATWYRCLVSCNAGAPVASTAVQVTQTLCYCASTATDPDDSEIFNVTLGSLNNSSGCNATAPGYGSVNAQYSNYISLPAPSLTQGSANPINLTLGYCDGQAFNVSAAVFIDFNQNAVFDASERVYNTPYQSYAVNGTVVTGSVVIPQCATPGLTRMRVVMTEGTSTPAACGTYNWGETEDYLVNIVAAAVVNPVATNISGPLTGTCGTNLNYSIASGFVGTIQWQFATALAGPYTDIAGANSTTQILNAPNPGTYYLRVRFIGQGCVSDAISNVLTIVIGSPVITITRSTPSNNICRGTQVTLTANGTGPYLWNTGAATQSISVSPLFTTTYNVSVGTGTCAGAGSITLTVIGGPVAAASATPATVQCPGTARNLAANLVSGITPTATFTGGAINLPVGAPLQIPFLGINIIPSPYPSGLSVSGMTGYTISNVKINGISHPQANDLDVALVAPNGSKVLLLADNGGINSLSGVNLTFQDGAANLPGTLTSGTFRTTTNTSWNGDNISAPFGTTLASFSGGMNGNWSLYVWDDETDIDPAGSITSWSITFTAPFQPFNTNGPITYTWTGTNGFTANIANTVDYPEVPSTYTLTVADNTCSSSTQVSTNVFPAPSVTTFTGSPFCENSTIDFFTDGNATTSTPSNGSLTVNISGPGFMDELSWTVRNSANVVIASGGNYANGSSNSVAVNPAATDYPVTFFIETQGPFGDNTADYSIICSLGTDTIVSGTILGGNTFTSTPQFCGSPAGNIIYNWSGPNSFSSTLEDPTIPSAQQSDGGNYTVTIIDGHGCMDSYTTDVVINDNPEPFIATNIPVSCNGFADGLFQVGINGGTPFYSFFEGSLGQTFTGLYTGVPAGTYYVDISDLNGCMSAAPLEIIVETTPNVAPVINCPASFSVTNDVGVCGAVVNFVTPVGTDVCPVLGTTQTSGLPSGSVFPIGTTINSYEVMDDLGLATSCSFTVTVIDNLPPVFSPAAADMIVECDGAGNIGELNAWLSSFGGAIANDECGTVSWSDNFSSFTGLCGGTGSVTVTFAATDANSNVATTTATFTIVDTTVPTITAASDQTVECDGNGNAGALAAWIGSNGGATASDACSAISWSNNFTSLSALCGATGNATVTFTATDACGNASSSTASFIIEDNTAPALSSPAPIIVNNDLNQCGASVGYAATASDMCSGSASIAYDIAPGSFFGIGTTTVNVSATDACGNISNSSFTVTVNDAQLPEIVCAGNISTLNDAGICGALETFAISFNDNCPGSTMVQTAGLPSGSVFPVGTTVNTFEVTDASGNSNTCSFSVSVTDSELPTIANCPVSFSSCNPITWTPPSITDNCPGIQITSTHLPGTNFPVGTTTVTYTATDAYNNVSTCSFQVTRLEESVSPTSITSNRDYNNICSGENITLTLNGGTLGEQATWKWYRASCGGIALPAFNGMTSITVNPTVTTTYFARAEGLCNNSACVSITVVVSTTAPPNGILAITGMPSFGAVGQTGTVTCTPVPGATFYRWTSILGHINAIHFPPGTVGPVETTIPSVDIIFNLALQNYQIRVVAGNACGRTNNVSGHIRGTVPATTCLDGPVLACPNTTATYSVANCQIPGTNGYQWSVSGNTTITSGQGTHTITVAFGAGFTSSQVCVNGVSNFGLGGPQTCLTVSNSTVAPGTIFGNDEPCESGFEDYTIVPVTGASSYLWTTNIVGAIVNGTSTTGSVQFPSGSFSGEVCVQAVTSCGTSTTSCINVTSGIPGIPGSILGPESGICGAIGNYSLPTNDAISYNWILPAGVTFASANGSNSVQLQFPSVPGSHTITVEAFYDCGSATSSITVDGAPGTPLVTPATICAGGSDETYIATAAGADNFIWTTSGADYEQCSNPNCSNYYIMWDNAGGSFSVAAQNQCGVSAVPFSLSTNCRISDGGQMETRVYPNPTTGALNIEFSSYAGGNYNLTITDMAGRSVLADNIKASSGMNKHHVDLSHALPGMYMLYLKDGSGNISVTKITVE